MHVRHIAHWPSGLLPLTGNGVPGAEGVASGGGGEGGTAAGADDAAGDAEAPGCVPGAAPGGFVPAAGWAREPGPSTVAPVGVVDGEDDAGGAEAAGGAATAAAAAGAGEAAAGVAIGPACAGFFRASSTTASSMARSIGTLTVPLFLSTQE